MQYEVIRSSKRRKTVQARLVNGVMQVSIPARMTKAEEARWVTEMLGRFERRQATEPIDLAGRAELLAARYRLPQPATIRWVENQEWRWGSCTPTDRSIRLSTRVGGFPGWVIDYVIVHELAHLLVAGHGQDFWHLVERYPRTERARGFLIAKGMDDADGEGRDDSVVAGEDGGTVIPRGPRVRPRVGPPARPASEQRTLW